MIGIVASGAGNFLFGVKSNANDTMASFQAFIDRGGTDISANILRSYTLLTAGDANFSSHGSGTMWHLDPVGAGTYTFYFAVDLGGGQLYYDSVNVPIQQELAEINYENFDKP